MGEKAFGKARWTARTDIRSVLQSWFARRLGVRQVEIIDIYRPEGAGMSSLTYLLTIAWHDPDGDRTENLVLRQQPAKMPLFYRAKLPTWARAQQIVAERIESVPSVLFIEPDRSILGAPFMVMNRIRGRIPPDQPPYRVSGWVVERSPDERLLLWRSAVGVLVDIHRLDWRGAGLEFLRRGSGANEVAAQVRYFVAYCDWAYGYRSELVTRASHWLAANTPVPERLCLTWGDARPSNIVFAQDRCVGALDWELVSIGDPAQDLAWWNFSEYMFDRLLGSQPPDGCLAGDGLLAVYEELSGARLLNYRFYEIFNALRALAIYERSVAIQRAQGVLVPPGMGTGDNFVTAALSTMLDRAESGAGGLHYLTIS